MKKNRIKKEKTRKERKPLAPIIKRLYTEPLPPAIEARVRPILYIGILGIILTAIAFIVKTTRGVAPFFAIITLTMLIYGSWLRFEVIRHGYREMVFKVVDYTSLTRILLPNARPSGMLLIRSEADSPDDRSIYHIGVSGKEDLPPVGWLIRAYVPADAEPAEFNGRLYFPSVYGYKIEGEDVD